MIVDWVLVGGLRLLESIFPVTNSVFIVDVDEDEQLPSPAGPTKVTPTNLQNQTEHSEIILLYSYEILSN